MNIAFVSTMNKIYMSIMEKDFRKFAKFASILNYLLFRRHYPEEILKISENIFTLRLTNDAHTEFSNKFSSLAKKGLKLS